MFVNVLWLSCSETVCCFMQLAFGSFLGVLGLCLEENRKQLVYSPFLSHSLPPNSPPSPNSPSLSIYLHDYLILLIPLACCLTLDFAWPGNSPSEPCLSLLQIVAAIVFLSFGVMTSFLCLVVDGVFIVFNMVSWQRHGVLSAKHSFNHSVFQVFLN